MRARALRGHGNLLQYSLPGESYGQRSLMGYRPQGCRVRHEATEHAHTCISSFGFPSHLGHHSILKSSLCSTVSSHWLFIGYIMLYICQSDLPIHATVPFHLVFISLFPMSALQIRSSISICSFSFKMKMFLLWVTLTSHIGSLCYAVQYCF